MATTKSYQAIALAINLIAAHVKSPRGRPEGGSDMRFPCHLCPGDASKKDHYVKQ